jgi:hypothetical protein
MGSFFFFFFEKKNGMDFFVPPLAPPNKIVPLKPKQNH